MNRKISFEILPFESSYTIVNMTLSAIELAPYPYCFGGQNALHIEGTVTKDYILGDLS